jgi:hypothetical protein
VAARRKRATIRSVACDQPLPRVTAALREHERHLRSSGDRSDESVEPTLRTLRRDARLPLGAAATGERGANTVADHLEVLESTLAELPTDVAAGQRVDDAWVPRTPSARFRRPSGTRREAPKAYRKPPHSGYSFYNLVP